MLQVDTVQKERKTQSQVVWIEAERLDWANAVSSGISLALTQRCATFYVHNPSEIIKLQESELYVLETCLK